MKNIKDFTLKEYDQYKELLNAPDFNIFELMELFGVKDAETMEIGEFNRITQIVLNEYIDVSEGIKDYYYFGGKKFKSVLEIKDVKAAQFIDFQSFISRGNKHEIISCFMLPVVRGGLFKREKVLSYNDGYDLLEVQKLIYENMTIGEAIALGNFFLDLSLTLLPIMRNCLMAQMVKTELKMKKKKEKMKKK